MLIDQYVIVEQPLGFEYTNHPNHVYKLKMALHGSKQVPRAWHGMLSNLLVEFFY